MREECNDVWLPDSGYEFRTHRMREGRILSGEWKNGMGVELVKSVVQRN